MEQRVTVHIEAVDTRALTHIVVAMGVAKKSGLLDEEQLEQIGPVMEALSLARFPALAH